MTPDAPDPAPNKVEMAPSGRAGCRGCSDPILKGTPRFAEAFKNPYADGDGVSYRYWHLGCAAIKLANEVAVTLAAYDGVLENREALDALVSKHLRAEMPYAERAGSGRARCRACDTTIKKGELRIAFERAFESPMGQQKGAAYAHLPCLGRYLERERERGREAPERGETVARILFNSRLSADDLALAKRELSSD